ncbi:MAG: hypothetical protein ACKOPN_11140 [Prochlorococcaceae cyanobacterium]
MADGEMGTADILKPSGLRRLADALPLLRALQGLPLRLALAAGREPLAWFLLLLGGLSDVADGAADGGAAPLVRPAQ